MTDLSPAAQAVYDAYCEGADNPHYYEGSGLVAALRAAIAHTQQYQGNDCYSNEVWTCDSDELFAIANELEQLDD
jgi:hypothetical protein